MGFFWESGLGLIGEDEAVGLFLLGSWSSIGEPGVVGACGLAAG